MGYLLCMVSSWTTSCNHIGCVAVSLVSLCFAAIQLTYRFEIILCSFSPWQHKEPRVAALHLQSTCQVWASMDIYALTRKKRPTHLTLGQSTTISRPPLSTIDTIESPTLTEQSSVDSKQQSSLNSASSFSEPVTGPPTRHHWKVSFKGYVPLLSSSSSTDDQSCILLA